MAIDIQTKQPVDTEVESANTEEEIFETEKPPFLIPYLIAFLSWIEELITALSGYGLTFALAVGVVDLLTAGSFTEQNPWVDYAYAWAMALGIGGQLVGAASRSSRSFNRGQNWKGIAYSILVLALAIVEYQASMIFGFHKTFGTPVSQSISDLGMTASQFIQCRTLVGVSLVVLSGFLRYQPSKPKTVSQLKSEAERRIQLKSIKAQERTANIKTNASMLRSAAATIRGNTDPLE